MNINPPEVFAALAHETRLRCLLLLLAHDELCVCELTGAIGSPQPSISRHLAQLRSLGLVLDRRDGHWIHYRLNPGLPSWIRELLTTTRGAVAGRAPFSEDLAALGAKPGRACG